MRLVLRATVVLAALALAPAALAHKPVFGGENGLLDAVTSYARYDAITAGRATMTYRVRVGAERRLLVELLIPDRAPENTLPPESLPRVRVLGGDARTWKLPRIRSTFDEPFTQTRYVRIGRRLIRDLPPGVYDLVVTGISTGRFVLVTGERESFGVGDVAKLPLTIARVQTWYRQGATDPPGQIGAVFWLIPAIAALIGVIVLVAIGWLVAAIVARLRRPPRAPVGAVIR